ncbi:MAG: hypothetical protein HZA58_08105 [Acidimicrobiia bacterium]|nr:hypothetical protein [Acidimicrobiia bacterium]
MLDPHPGSAVEYWFFKVNSGGEALLVDWIARRRSGDHAVRVSIHSPRGRAVRFLPIPVVSLAEGENTLTETHTKGRVEDVTWDLAMEILDPPIAPDVFPARLLHLLDLAVVVAPEVRFTGSMTHAGQSFEVAGAKGVLAQYWGRRLPREWWWISTNQFDAPDLAVECDLFRSGVWGIPASAPAGYLFIKHGELRKLIMSPTARTRVSGTPEKFEIAFRRLGKPSIRLRATGSSYGDLGERIVNTLVGDLEVWEGNTLIGRATGTAGLERRPR